ncbi:hypothetical protein C8R46DRAFT_1042126 [Mycena filopes]|nr:hypothetical protein C8R46DRAFT_1042126 [Mycena filopes]
MCLAIGDLLREMRIGPGQRGFSELDLDLPNVAAAPSAAVNADRDTSTIFMNVVCGKLSSTSRSSRSGTCSLSLPVKRTATHSRYVAPAISGTMNEFSTYAMDPAFLKAGNPSSPTACPTEQLLATETVCVRIPVCSQLKDLRKVRTSSLDQIPTFYDPDAERTLDLRRLRQQQQYLDMTLRQLLELLDSYDHNVRVPVPTDLGSLDLPPNNSLYLQIQAGAEKVTQNLLRVGDSIDRLAAIYTPYTPFCLPLDLTSSWMGFDLSSLYPDVQPISFPMPPSDAPSHASMWNLEQILGTNPCIDPALLNGGEELRPESQEAQTAPVVTAHLLVEAPNAAPPGAQHAIEPPFVERERKNLNGYIRNEMLRFMGIAYDRNIRNMYQAKQFTTLAENVAYGSRAPGALTPALQSMRPCWEDIKGPWNAALGVLFVKHFMGEYPEFRHRPGYVEASFHRRLAAHKKGNPEVLQRGGAKAPAKAEHEATGCGGAGTRVRRRLTNPRATSMELLGEEVQSVGVPRKHEATGGGGAGTRVRRRQLNPRATSMELLGEEVQSGGRLVANSQGVAKHPVLLKRDMHRTELACRASMRRPGAAAREHG